MRPSPRRTALALLALAGCGRAEPPADPAGLEPRPVVIGDQTWTVLVPPEALVEVQSGPGGDEATVSFGPATRAAPTMTLADGPADSAGAAAAYPHTATLASGATLDYRTRVEEAEGSSGSVAVLEGRLTVPDGPGLDVGCTEQREEPRPTWCVAYLHHLRPERR